MKKDAASPYIYMRHRVLLVGELMLDPFVHLKKRRLSYTWLHISDSPIRQLASLSTNSV
jgi:hypothetical protein